MGREFIMSVTDFIKPYIRQLTPYNAVHISSPIKMDIMENPYNLPDEFVSEITEMVHTMAYNRYPDPTAKILREALAGYLGISPEWIMVGNGSDELINYIITAVRQKVIWPEPTFAIYEILARTMNCSVIGIPLDEAFDLDLKAMIEEIRRDGGIIFLSVPNNPTGNYFSGERIYHLLEQKRTLVVIDEAYYEFCQKTFLSEIKRYPNLVILRTFSKAFGLAGLRVGYMIAQPELIVELNKIKLPYSVDTFSQMVAVKVLEGISTIKPRIEEIIGNREILYNRLKKISGVKPYPSMTNFILFKVSHPEWIWEGLVRNGILIRNLSKPGRLEGCLRVTVGTSEENDIFCEKLTALM